MDSAGRIQKVKSTASPTLPQESHFLKKMFLNAKKEGGREHCPEENTPLPRPAAEKPSPVCHQGFTQPHNGQGGVNKSHALRI